MSKTSNPIAGDSTSTDEIKNALLSDHHDSILWAMSFLNKEGGPDVPTNTDNKEELKKQAPVFVEWYDKQVNQQELNRNFKQYMMLQSPIHLE